MILIYALQQCMTHILFALKSKLDTISKKTLETDLIFKFNSQTFTQQIVFLKVSQFS